DAAIDLVLDQARRRRERAHDLRGAVIRAVVDDDQVAPVARRRVAQRLEAGADVLTRVPGEDDDRVVGALVHGTSVGCGLLEMTGDQRMLLPRRAATSATPRAQKRTPRLTATSGRSDAPRTRSMAPRR